MTAAGTGGNGGQGGSTGPAGAGGTGGDKGMDAFGGAGGGVGYCVELVDTGNSGTGTIVVTCTFGSRSHKRRTINIPKIILKSHF